MLQCAAVTFVVLSCIQCAASAPTADRQTSPYAYATPETSCVSVHDMLEQDAFQNAKAFVTKAELTLADGASVLLAVDSMRCAVWASPTNADWWFTLGLLLSETDVGMASGARLIYV